MQNLETIAQKIYQLEIQIHRLQEGLIIEEENLSFLNGSIEEAIANNKSLKNEQQRKAERIARRQMPDYLETTTAIKRLKSDIRLSEIELNFLKNQFSVAKLQYRKDIASMLVFSPSTNGDLADIEF